MDANRLIGVTMAFNSSALTATGAETVHDSTVAMNYCVNGKVVQKSGTNADQTTPTTDYNTGSAFPVLVGGGSVANAYGYGCVVVWAYTAAGVVKCMMGPHVRLTDNNGTFAVPPQFPPVPSDVCPFAYQVCKAKYNAAAAGWSFGTSNWNATGCSQAIVNISTLPDRPQTS
jgi:hypothetical protein